MRRELVLNTELRRAATAGTVWSATLVGAGAGFLAQVAIARHLGPSGLAPLAAVTSVVNVVVPLALLGAGTELVRAYGAKGQVPVPFLRGLLLTVWALAGAAALAGSAWIALTKSWDYSGLISLLTVPLVLGGTAALLVDAVFIVEGPRWAVLAWLVLPNVLRLGAVGLAVGLDAGLHGVVIALSCTGLVLSSTALVPLLRRSSGREAGPRWSMRSFLASSWPFALSSSLYGLFVQGGILWVGFAGEPTQIGILSVAMTVYLVTHLLSHALSQRLLQVRFTRLLASANERLQGVFRAAELRMAFVGVVFAVLGVAIVPWGIPRVFGPGLDEAVLPAQILLCAAPFRFASSVSSAFLNAGVAPRRNTLVESVATVSQLALAGPLVIAMGALGAACALVVGELILAGGLYLAVRKTGTRPGRGNSAAPTMLMPPA